MKFHFQSLRTLLVVLCAVATAGCTEEILDLTTDPQQLEVRYDEAGQHLQVIVHPGLNAGETLHVQVRNGPVGVLECSQMANGIQRVDGVYLGPMDGGHAYRGPNVDPNWFNAPYNDIAWLETEGPTAEMIAAAEAGTFTIDLCIMRGNQVIRNAEMEIRRALDRKGTGKFDGYGDTNERIESVSAYAQACVAQIGEIPFFAPLAEGDYTTYNCLDSTPIPMTVTDNDGQVTWPSEKVQVCDNPQFIYSLCEPNAVTGQTNGPRVTSATNEQGTQWVLLCRKSKAEEGSYNDIAMLGHNPYTGRTCYFQNALYSRTDGLHIPHPADTVDSPGSPQQSTTLWSGIQGGIGSGIECVTCHDSDPFIHTPWIDGALDERGDTIVPMMGVHDGLAQGYNEAPYTLVNREGQGWTMPKVLTSPEAAPCTKCHRIAAGRWTRSWLNRLNGTDTSWNNIVTEPFRAFSHMYWMPPEAEGIDESTWAESEYGIAMEFVMECARTPDNPACQWAELPTEQLAEPGELPPIELEGTELANEALKILGANVSDLNDPRCQGEDGSCASRRCAECHSVSKSGLRHWAKLTTTAQSGCNLVDDPETLTPEQAMDAVACLRARPDDPDSVYAADKVGILTTGARYGYFRKLFRRAFGDENWLQPYIQFKARVSMPKGTYSALSQQEHAIILKWFASGLSHLDEIIQDPPPPTECVPYFDKEFFENHIGTMRYDGWGAVNKENGIAMFGCPDDNPANCFSNSAFPDRTQEWTGGKGNLREVVHLSFRTSFWTRSSADGRFIGNGGGSGVGATITDMLRNVDVGIKGSYDPGFFPDNSGFVMQGGGIGICTQTLLETEDHIDYTEPGCIKGTNINLYQHVARGLNGGDYFIINSQFTSDSGSNTTKDPVAHFSASSTMKFSPMIFNGTTYEQLSAVIVDSPYEGDSVLSPSGQLVISRLAGGESSQPLGYVIRNVVTERFENNYQINIEKEVARVCTSGAKANISYDERFFVTHHYENGTANIYMHDFLSGQYYTVTNMPEGTKALFPHFRSDGWFYFLVKTADSEYVVASDLAVTLSGGGQ